MLDKLLDRPVSVTMVLLVFMVLGVIGIGRIPVSLIPDVDIPYVTVRTSSPDMSAREMDDAVVKPLRQSLVQLSHLKDIRSESKDGSATITLTFEEGSDIDYLFVEVNEKIDRAMGSLPRIERPKVFKASATDIPAFYLNLTLKDGAGDFLRMSEFAEDVIAKRIEQLPEVAMVDMTGTAGREILVIPDPEAFSRLGMTMDRFESCVSSANVSLSNLTIRDGEYHYNVKFRSFASSAEDVGNVWFKIGERTLQVKDVASVEERMAPRSGLARSNGQDAVTLAVIKQNEARMSALKKSISEQISVFENDYPQVSFSMARDQTELLDYSIRNLLLNIIVAIILDIIVIFIFLKDMRSSMLVAMAIPVSLVASFFVFYAIGLTVNIISLAGLLLGVGMMVDNTIVLIDNITMRWRAGEALRTAVVEGTKEVWGAMLSSVLTTCAVFIPLVFLNGLAGELFYDQAVSVTTVLLVSFVVTVTLLPVYYWLVYKRMPEYKVSGFMHRVRFGSAKQLYDRIVTWCLSDRWIVWALPLLSIVMIAVCIWGMDKEKLPPITYSDAVLKIDWNDNITLDENRSRIIGLENLVKERAAGTSAQVGVQQFVLGHSDDQSMSEAAFYVDCRNAGDLADVKALLDGHIRGAYPGAICGWSTSGNIFDMVFSEKEPELLARLRPVDGGELKVESVREALRKVRSALPAAAVDDIPLKKDVLYISDPERMALYGVGFQELADALKNALDGNGLFEIVQGGRSVPVIAGTDAGELSAILAKTVVSVPDVMNEGKTVDIPASALMRQTFEEDFKALVSGDDGNYYPVNLEMPSKEIPDAMSRLKDVFRHDDAFDVAFSGTWFSNREMVRQMSMVLLIAVALLFLILASQFESLIQPFIILSEIVIDIAFSMAFLWIAGVSINMMSLIGFVVITGIVINDSILKIDTINRLVRSGYKLEAAVHEAGHKRLKSIVMTSLTTVLAVAPFLSKGNMGSDLQYPMALVIIVGMSIGTLVSLFYVPTVYATIYRRKAK